MDQDKNKEYLDINEIVPTISEEEDDIERLIENFNKLQQQNSSLLERVRSLENRDKKDDKYDNENLLRVPNNSGSDVTSSVSASPDISDIDRKVVVPTLSSSEEDLDADYNEGKNQKYVKKYEREGPEESPGLQKKGSQKEHKTAWSKMKEIITTTKVGGTKKRHLDEPIDTSKVSQESLLNERSAGVSESRLQAPRLVLTHPSTEDLNRQEPEVSRNREKHRPSPLQPTWQDSSPVDEEGPGELSPPLTRKSSKWFKVKNVFLPSPGGHSNKSTSNPSSPMTFKSFTYELDPEESNNYDQLDEISKETNPNIQDEVRRNYRQLQKKLSDEFHCKFVEWEKGRKCGGSFSSGNSSVDECERRRVQETEELRSYGGGPDNNTQPPEKKLTNEFKKKLEEWDRLKGVETPCSPGPGREPPRRKISDWQAWGRANSQRKKEEGKKRRGSDSPTSKEGSNIKELAWIDKELNKVAKEKLRLDKEKEKFTQREARLKKMKLSLEGRREEVLIPTSTGTFRFQGISEKFTKKLYEWEKARGIGPEASTIALLDPAYTLSHSPGESTGVVLIRSKSIGSIADLATPCQLTNHPSSLSLNNVGLLDDTRKMATLVVEEGEGFSSTAVTPDFSLAPDDQPHLVDSSGSDLDHEIMKFSKERKSYQYCDESKCLIEKLKKEREMCRELEQNIESLEGRISELSKSLERIDAGSSRTCGIIHEVSHKCKTREEYIEDEDCGEECEMVNKEELQTSVKEGLSEIWLISREQALNELQHLTEHLLQIVEKLDNWVIDSDNDRVPGSVSPTENSQLDKTNFWVPNHHNNHCECHGGNQNVIDLTSFTNIMKEKITEIRRVLGYLYSNKEDRCRRLDTETMEQEENFLYDSKDQMDETQDTENDCSSRASSFTYQEPDFHDKNYDESWQWNKDNYKSFQNEMFPFQHNHLECLRENESCSSFSDLDSSTNNLYKINDKPEFSVHELASPMGALKPWDNRSDLNDENQFEILSDISSNIVVPTVRKIFSPVFLEENGETSFIEVVLEENIEGTEDQQNIEEDNNLSDKAESTNRDFLPSQMNNGNNVESSQLITRNNIDQVNQDNNSQKNIKNEVVQQVQENKPEASQMEEELNEIENKNIVDIGFPPISPLRGRREFRSPKETSTLKRMIAARQNKRIYDIDFDSRNRSNSSSPEANSDKVQSKSNQNLENGRFGGTSEKRLFSSVESAFLPTSHPRAFSTDRRSTDFTEKSILKASSTSALKNSHDFQLIKCDSLQRKSTICESINYLEEKHKADHLLTTPECLQLRALKIQKAKQDFFNTQLLQVKTNQDVNKNDECSQQENKEVDKKIDKELNKEELVESKENKEQTFTKSASEGTINIPEENTEGQTTLKKSKFAGLASRFSVVLRKGTQSADSSLRRSLAIPTSQQVNDDQEPRSCPSSPILQREEPGWWSLNPAKNIFRPKGKYKFNKKS